MNIKIDRCSCLCVSVTVGENVLESFSLCVCEGMCYSCILLMCCCSFMSAKIQSKTNMKIDVRQERECTIGIGRLVARLVCRMIKFPSLLPLVDRLSAMSIWIMMELRNFDPVCH